MPRYVDVSSTPVFLFNMAGLANKFISALAALTAAICHAIGSDWVYRALDVLVATLAIGIAMTLTWLVVRFVFGIEMETAKDLKLIPNNSFHGR